MEEIFGISLGAATVFAVIVMMIVNAIKADVPTLKAWHIRLISVGISFIIVLLAWLGKGPIDWLMYVKTSLAVGMYASGIWDTTKQVRLTIAKPII